MNRNIRSVINRGLAILVVGALATSTGFANEDTQTKGKHNPDIRVGDIVFPVSEAGFGDNDLLCTPKIAGMRFKPSSVPLIPVFWLGPFSAIGWFAAVCDGHVSVLVPIGLFASSFAIDFAAASANVCGRYATVTALRQDDTIEVAYGINSYLGHSTRVNIKDVKVTQ